MKIIILALLFMSQAFSLAISWQNADEYNPRPKAIPWQDASYTVTSCPQGYSETTGTETSKGECKKTLQFVLLAIQKQQELKLQKVNVNEQ
mgnify:CR=1 FL=1